MAEELGSQISVSISIVHLTSGLSLCSPTPSLVSLADSLTGKEHGGGVTHAWEDIPVSTSAPISFSSTGKPALVSGNDHPHEAGPSSLGTTRREASHWATASLGGGKEWGLGSPGWEVTKYLATYLMTLTGLPWWLSGKESACSAGDTGSILGSGRFPGKGNDIPLQHSFLENSMNRTAWQATYSPWGHKSRTRLSD